jgi:hypothetical protein
VSTARVDFTRGAAERIAAVVRQVEGGNRDGAPLTFGKVDTPGGKAIRFCSWSSTWSYNATATITFSPGTSNTATATNVILGVGPGDGWVARKGSAGWSLVAFDMTKQPGYAAGEIQLFGHSTSSAVVQWYSITTCATATSSP